MKHTLILPLLAIASLSASETREPASALSPGTTFSRASLPALYQEVLGWLDATAEDTNGIQWKETAEQYHLKSGRRKAIGTVAVKARLENHETIYTEIMVDGCRRKKRMADVGPPWMSQEVDIVRGIGESLARNEYQIDSLSEPGNLGVLKLAREGRENAGGWKLVINGHLMSPRFREQITIDRATGRPLTIERVVLAEASLLEEHCQEIRWVLELAPAGFQGRSYVLPSAGLFTVTAVDQSAQQSATRFLDFHKDEAGSSIRFEEVSSSIRFLTR